MKCRFSRKLLIYLFSVCTPDKTNSTRCFCKSENDDSGDTCLANQGCDKDGICFDGKYYSNLNIYPLIKNILTFLI